MIVKKELDWIDIDDIGNLRGFILRLVFIDKECGNPTVVN